MKKKIVGEDYQELGGSGGEEEGWKLVLEKLTFFSPLLYRNHRPTIRFHILEIKLIQAFYYLFCKKVRGNCSYV